MSSKLILCATLMSFFAILSAATQSFAIDEDAIKATEKIKSNPALMEMLKKIELSKKILAEMQEKSRVQEQKKQHVEEMRKASQQDLSAELDRMNKDNEPFTPANSFARFVSSKPTAVQDIYWSMFNYQQAKIAAAKDARDKILENGGTRDEAWNAFYKNSATTRLQMIQLNKDFNVRYVSSNIDVQNTFDASGKLPRTD